MPRLFIRILIVAGVLALTAFAVYTGLRAHAAEKEAHRLGTELEARQAREQLLKQKYSESRAQIDSLMRTNQRAEGLCRKAIADCEARFAQSEVQSGIAEEKTRIDQQRIASLEEHVAELQGEKEAIIKSREAVQGELKQATEHMAALEKDLDAMRSKKEVLDSDLTAERSRLDDCRRHNQEFAKITAELIEKYKNKDVRTSLLQAEPFTQIKQVQIERMLQDYLDRADKAKLRQ